MEPTVQILIDAVGHSMGGGNEELAKAMASEFHLEFTSDN